MAHSDAVARAAAFSLRAPPRAAGAPAPSGVSLRTVGDGTPQAPRARTLRPMIRAFRAETRERVPR